MIRPMTKNLRLIPAALAVVLFIGTVDADPDLTGLWTFRCDEDLTSADPLPLAEFSAAIFMMGPAISGVCTGETPDPWNGLVTGRFEDGSLDLQVLLVQHPLTVARLTGAYNDSGSLAGTFVCSDETGSGWKGSFSSTLTSPETSLYEPASSEPLSFAPAVSGGISDFEEVEMTPAVEEAPKAREVQVISYSRDTIYSRPVL